MSDNNEIKLPVHPLINPLTPADRAALEQFLIDAEKVDDLIIRSHECGVNVGVHAEAHEAYKQIAQKMMQRFFPPQLPVPE